MFFKGLVKIAFEIFEVTLITNIPIPFLKNNCNTWISALHLDYRNSTKAMQIAFYLKKI